MNDFLVHLLPQIKLFTGRFLSLLSLCSWHLSEGLANDSYSGSYPFLSQKTELKSDLCHFAATGPWQVTGSLSSSDP